LIKYILLTLFITLIERVTMGIRSLVSLIDQKCGADCIKQISLSDLAPGTVICIDISEFIYRSLLKEQDNHIAGILNLLEKLFRFGLVPIFVFDGHAPEEKQYLLDEKRKSREKAKDKLKQLNEDTFKIQQQVNLLAENQPVPAENKGEKDDHYIPFLSGIEQLQIQLIQVQNDVEKERKKTVGLAERQILQIKELFDMLGIPYIHLPMEADIICSRLVIYGIADYCISNDMDLLALGCPRVIRNIKFSTDTVDVYYYQPILNAMNLNNTEFIDLCIMLGCDYTTRVNGLKPDFAIKLIQQYKSIEAFITAIPEINIELDKTEPGKYIKVPTHFDYIKARNIFNDTSLTGDMLAGQFYDRPRDIISKVSMYLQTNSHAYNAVYQYCKLNCPRLSNTLINKKINTIVFNKLMHSVNIPKRKLELSYPVSVDECR
jgi:5'-3' exonuclease